LVWFATHFRDLATIMAERNGVISLHLAVEMTDTAAMTMLYKIAEGAVRESHYGLALARVVPLPPGLLEHAQLVAQKLESNILRRRKTSANVIKERRRKLILNLKEHLVQARNGSIQGETLAAWLRELRREFVVQMGRIDGLAKEAEADEESTDEEEGVGVMDREGAKARELVEVDDETKTRSTGETMSE
jgi:DNA mismatch repair protein MSH4